MIRLITIAVLISACTDQHTQASISGSYVGKFQNEFSKGMDTLSITAFNPEKGIYYVVRKTGYCPIREGVVQARRYKKDSSLATYDDRTGQLEDRQQGRLYTFSARGDQLVIGAATYFKIDE